MNQTRATSVNRGTRGESHSPRHGFWGHPHQPLRQRGGRGWRRQAILAQAILTQAVVLLVRTTSDSFGFSFASPVSRPSRFLMVHRGWRSADVPDGWVQVIRGPRPRSIQWPRASPQSRPVPVQSSPLSQPKQSSVPKTSGTRPFGDPQVRVTAAQERVAKLEAALAVLHGVDGPEVESLRVVLKRAKEVKVQPVDSGWRR